MNPLLVLVIIGYIVGLMIWNQRAFSLYQSQVNKPWREAIGRYDWHAVDHWKKVAESFPLQDWDYMLNPYRWVTCWRWKP